MPTEIDGKHEAEKEALDFNIMYRSVLDSSEIPKLEIPFTVQDIISRIEEAQHYRAREDLNMQLNDIMVNVQRIINRYSIDEHVHSGRKISLSEHKKRRTSLLEKIVNCAKAAEIKEKTLAFLLAWLEEWNVILSAMTAIDIDEHHHWIAQMEMLPETFKTIESNVKLLTKIRASLLEEKKKQKKKSASRGSLWKSWKERVIKRPATAHALRPDQMISDEFATNRKISEIQDMLQELIGTAMFNKLENNAIKYISSTIANLSKALSTLNDEVKIISLQGTNMYINETDEKGISLKIIQDLSEKNEMLQQKLQKAEENYEQLLRSRGAELKALPTSALKVLPEPSRESSTATSQGGIEDSIDNILANEFANIVDKSQRKGTTPLGRRRNSAISHAAPVEMFPDLTEQQHPLPEKKQKKSSKDIPEDKVSVEKGAAIQEDVPDQHQSQKQKHTKGPYVKETSESTLSDDKGKQKVSGTKLDHDLDLQALEKKRKEKKSFSEAKSKSVPETKSQHPPADFPSMDTKSQGSRDGTSGIWELLRKAKLETSLSKSPNASEKKEELTPVSMDKEGKKEGAKMSSQVEPSSVSQLDYSSEKVKLKGKKQQISPGTTASKEEKTEEKDMVALAQTVKSHELVKTQPRITKETLGTADDKSEQSNLEAFQEAIVSFLKEKIDATGKTLDKKTVPKEELLLKRAEVEKLGIIKSKMEEYFQKVAENVARILRKYKDIKNAVGEKPMKQKKVVSFMPGPHVQKSLSAKSEINTLLSHESLDPLTDNLIQMILTEIESEGDIPAASTVGRDHKEKEKQRREEYLQEGRQKNFGTISKHQLQEERSYEMINKNLEKEGAWLPMKEERQEQQKQKQWQEEEVWKEQQKQRMSKQIEPGKKKKQREEEKERRLEAEEQQLEAWKQKMKVQEVPLEKEKGQQMIQVQKKVRYLEQESSWKEAEEKQKPRKKAEDQKRQTQKTAKEMKTLQELVQALSQTSVTWSPRWKSTPKATAQLHQRKEFDGNLKKLGALPDGKYPVPIVPPISTRPSSPGGFSISGQPPTKLITLTPQQAPLFTPEEAQALGITPTSYQVQALGETPTPKMSQGLGAAHTPEQAWALGFPVTPEQAQAQGITLTPQQVQALGTPITPEQARAPRIPVTVEQAQALGLHATPEQAQALGIPVTIEQAQALGLHATPEQAQALGIPVTIEQAQALGIPVTIEQAQALGLHATPEQAQALGIPVTIEQAQALGIPVTIEQAQALGLHATPEQAQALGIPITPEQAGALRIPITAQQAQALGIHVTLQQAQDLGAPFPLGQAQALGVSLSPEQFGELGVHLTSDKAYASKSAHTPEQIQPLGTPFTLGQAQSMGVTLLSEQDLISRAPLSDEQPSKPWAGSPSGHTLEAGIFTTTDKSVIAHAPRIPRKSPAPSAPVAEKSLRFEVPSTTLRTSPFPFTPSPFVPEKSPGMRIPSDPRKLLAPQIFPSPRQIPVSKGQSTSVKFPTPAPSPISQLPPIPGQPLALEALLVSRQGFVSEDSLTPQSPLMSKPLLDSRQPLSSRVPATSAQIPSIVAPLSPRKPLVPWASSIPGELLESRPLTLSEQLQASQTPATHGQSPYLQASNILRQHLPPRTLPGQASPLWISPIPGPPPTLLAPSISGRPQEDLPSPVSKTSKERLSTIFPLKSKSALVHPRVPSFKVSQAPFATKKSQISEVSDTSEETQRPRDPFAVEQSRTHLTDYRTPVSQTPYIDEEVLPTPIKPVTSLPSPTTQLPKTSQSSPSEWDQTSRFPPIDKPWILTSVSGTKKPKMVVSTSYTQELKEEKYFVDVEAQRKNLILLNQATEASKLPSQLYTSAKKLIIETLHTDTVRLGYLFRKYIAYRLIQRARNNIVKRLQAIQNTGRGYETQNLYIMLNRIDDYQKKVMRIWSEKQKSLQQKRNQCLRKTMYLFSQLQEIYKLNLNQPIPLIMDKKQVHVSTKLVQQPFLKLLREEDRKYYIFNKFGQEDQMEAIWNADLSTSSYPITEKPSMYSLWAQLGGYPDIPMLLQLDVHSVFRRSLTCIQSKAAPSAYGGSQARGLIRAVAAGLQHSHNNARSELCLRPTPQLMATRDP